ncbi:hypothetical protein AGMMS50239_28070 [Bacteroidia bacterium]|nr:hypothetical protein AGMMS50239_28070 [Bacteroidia bacterium]
MIRCGFHGSIKKQINHMKSYIFLFVALFSCNVLLAQNTFRATIKDADTKEVLIGATVVVKGTANGYAADVNGVIFK